MKKPRSPRTPEGARATSRKDIQDILIRLTDVTGYAFQDSQANAAFQIAINEIERLLAQEREKVREVCCKVMCFRCAGGNIPMSSGAVWGHHLEKKVNSTTMRSWYENCEAVPIRQLDLTKDPVASSREEKGNV